MFIDKVKIKVKAGKGGNGCLSFRREKFVPLGGPDGGDGGKGGSVYISVDKNFDNLNYFYFHHNFVAEDGKNGEGNNRHGKKGRDIFIKVPQGTVVYLADQIIADLKNPDDTILVAKGGSGGRGNASFKSSINRSPKFAEKGLPGEEKILTLELKTIADVGIIGCPNAGKSTLLARLTNAKPKIADYPFTTTSPNVGICVYKNSRFIIADIPGLIEDAHKGKGLGIDFLRHIERTKILIHLIDVQGYNGKTPYQNFKIINKELKSYSNQLIKKTMIIALNKIDLSDTSKNLKSFKEKINKTIYPISAVTGSGIDKLLNRIQNLLSKYKQPKELKPPSDFVIEPDFTIKNINGKFVVSGKLVEDFVNKINFDYEDSLDRFQKFVKKIGLEKALLKAGAKNGNIILIGKNEFEFII